MPRYGLPGCPVIKGEQILRARATISNISRVVDRVCTLKCTVLGSNPRLRPMHYQEVRSRPLKYARDFIFDPFLQLFPFDSLGAVPENPCPDIHGVRFTMCPVYSGTTAVLTLCRYPPG